MFRNQSMQFIKLIEERRKIISSTGKEKASDKIQLPRNKNKAANVLICMCVRKRESFSFRIQNAQVHQRGPRVSPPGSWSVTVSCMEWKQGGRAPPSKQRGRDSIQATERPSGLPCTTTDHKVQARLSAAFTASFWFSGSSSPWSGANCPTSTHTAVL